MNKILLQLEGMTVFFLSLYVYSTSDFGWLLFIVLLFAPDLSMVGYLVNTKVGAIIYNLCHTYLISLFILFIGHFTATPLLQAIGLIWTAHIGMDRMLGYGLKYPTTFKDTHLQRM